MTPLSARIPSRLGGAPPTLPDKSFNAASTALSADSLTRATVAAPSRLTVRLANTLPQFRRLDVRTSFLQRIASDKRIYKLFLPLYPLAFEAFDLSQYDVVISSTTGFANGVVTTPNTVHFSYCNTPSRFAWRTHDYIRRDGVPLIAKAATWLVLHHLRVWDYVSAQRVDHFAMLPGILSPPSSTTCV